MTQPVARSPVRLARQNTSGTSSSGPVNRGGHSSGTTSSSGHSGRGSAGGGNHDYTQKPAEEQSGSKSKERAPEASTLIQVTNNLRQALFDFIDGSNGLTNLANGTSDTLFSLENIEKIRDFIGGQISDERDAIDTLGRIRQITPEIESEIAERGDALAKNALSVSEYAKELQRRVSSESGEARKVKEGKAVDQLFDTMQAMVYLADNIVTMTGKSS